MGRQTGLSKSSHRAPNRAIDCSGVTSTHASGCRELWFVDPEARNAEIFRLDPSSDTSPRTLADRHTLTSNVVPSLRLSLNTIWV